ncbi:MAG TPA: hypothetical protein VH275_01635 [Solirubrobacterales bacterium]|nr:hypothetical protein [Solirubrobacterales bacterium]
MRLSEIMEWEGRWLVPAGLATFAGVALVIASVFVIGGVSGEGDAELLRSVHEHSSSVTLSSILQAVGFVFLVAPLVVLFKATAARSDRVRYQLIGLVIAAPLFLSVSGVLSADATNKAATQFVAGNAKPGITAKAASEDCQSELQDIGAKEFGEEFGGGSRAVALKQCSATKVADEEASNAISEASTRDIATGLGLGGRLGLAVALLYSCLFAMRVGLLTRFWGSLGMALGVAALLLRVEFTMIWFIYFGLLLLGRLPGGRPPAWAAGEAIPWPTPGERAAESLEGTEPVDAREQLPPGDNGSADGERRKRKQRD